MTITVPPHPATFSAPILDDIAATGTWPTNAHLIADVARLGYLQADALTLDATHGEGTWWRLWRPGTLVTMDLVKSAGVRGDFTRPPFRADTFDAVAYDPPYKLNGRPTAEVDDRYGVGIYERWQDRMTLIVAGVEALADVLRPGGIMLVKCQDQVVSGAVRWQTDVVTNAAAAVGLDKIDRLDRLGSRPQPAGRRQVHARRNTSTLLVFRARPARRTHDGGGRTVGADRHRPPGPPAPIRHRMGSAAAGMYGSPDKLKARFNHAR
jgi:hypothetical protein